MATNKKDSGETVFHPQQLSQSIQNFVVLWLDASIDESTSECKEFLAQLSQSVGTTIETFKDANNCIQEIQETKSQKVLLIVSGYVGQNMVPKIHELPQVESIYVLCGNKSVHEKWANKISKVKAICTDIKSVCEGLKQDRQQYDKTMIPMSFQSCDPLFMYTQLVKEAILQIDYDDVESIKELAEFCRRKANIVRNQIEKFERDYVKEKAIWWYTAPYFLYSLINYALREFDVNVLMKMGFFIVHLHRQIQELAKEQHAHPQGLKIMAMPYFELYRGQGLPNEKFENLKQSIGGLMSFNNFLSTSYKKDISLTFARQSMSDDKVGILFFMQIDANLCKKANIPFVEITDKLGFYGDGEGEVLFTTHTLFRIENVQQISTDRLYQVNLMVASPDTYELKEVADSFNQEIGYRRGFARLAAIFLKSGLPEQAKDIYHALLEKATTGYDIAEYNYQLGWVYDVLGKYEKAIQHYELDLKYKKRTLPSNDLQFAASYNNIGMVYINMGDYSKALSSYQQSLEIRKQGLRPNHPDLAATYNNIGMVYNHLGDYPQALSSYQQALEIRKQALPPNHPDLATTYSNIGLVYNHLGDYSKTLSSYQQSLEIQKQVLPPNHPDLATSFNNIGLVYGQMGNYSKALSSHQKALEIRKEALPPSHPDFAASYNNIGMVYGQMGNYLQALVSFCESLDIQTQVLPPNHPDLAATFNNIGMVFDHIGEYSQALLAYQNALKIQKKALPPNHPDLATSYNNIATVYAQMGDYSEALMSFEQALEIRKQVLPPYHPELAATYNNIGIVHRKMGDYSKALEYYQKDLEITKKALPANHPSLADSYNNIGLVYENIKEYAKALSYYEQALQIKQISLPKGHPSTKGTFDNIERLKKKM